MCPRSHVQPLAGSAPLLLSVLDETRRL